MSAIITYFEGKKNSLRQTGRGLEILFVDVLFLSEELVL